jgi:primosomal protein N' (replication factor Y)
MKTQNVYQVALGAPVMRLFDYLPAAENGEAGRRGQRVLVPFGKTQRVGVLVRTGVESDFPRARLRRVIRLLDEIPLFDPTLMDMLEWASHYYHYPPGEVFMAALPLALRRGNALDRTEAGWKLTGDGETAGSDSIDKRASVQKKILALVTKSGGVLGAGELSVCGTGWRKSIVSLEERGLLERVVMEITTAVPRPLPDAAAPDMTADQARAVEAVDKNAGFKPYLLEGVTGSGKTEVYLRCIEKQLQSDAQTLVIVPEIGLTPQLVDRFRRRLNAHVVVMHSGLGDTERLDAWRAAREGSASVIIGTRSAIFVPLARPGLIVIDEEHDGSLKQQEGFRYSARDLAVWRARQLNIPIIMGSATPSFESLENIRNGRYRHLLLPERAGGAKQPDIRLIDLRVFPAQDGLTEPMLRAIRQHLEADGQVLVYLNRRGFAPTLMCTVCGHVEECRRCDARMVVHQGRARVVCHHCGAERAMPAGCGECNGELKPIGQGTERLETALRSLLPEYGLVRIDRDTTRRRGEIQRRLEQVRSGEARLLLGTQMLTKGHDFPNVTLVAIIDSDQGLFGTDFRSAERLAQSVIQVAGRAGRGDRPGEVLIQTSFPEHELLTELVGSGYRSFSERALVERQQAGWPPYTCLTLLRAESSPREAAFSFLAEAGELAVDLINDEGLAGVIVLGPAPAPMERRSGRFRGQLLIRAERRGDMQRFVSQWRMLLDNLKSARRTRWSLDVDPVELF